MRYLSDPPPPKKKVVWGLCEDRQLENGYYLDVMILKLIWKSEEMIKVKRKKFVKRDKDEKTFFPCNKLHYKLYFIITVKTVS